MAAAEATERAYACVTRVHVTERRARADDDREQEKGKKEIVRFVGMA